MRSWEGGGGWPRGQRKWARTGGRSTQQDHCGRSQSRSEAAAVASREALASTSRLARYRRKAPDRQPPAYRIWLKEPPEFRRSEAIPLRNACQPRERQPKRDASARRRSEARCSTPCENSGASGASRRRREREICAPRAQGPQRSGEDDLQRQQRVMTSPSSAFFLFRSTMATALRRRRTRECQEQPLGS